MRSRGALSVALCVLGAPGAHSNFDLADSDRNGYIDRAEFGRFGEHLQQELASLTGGVAPHAAAVPSAHSATADDAAAAAAASAGLPAGSIPDPLADITDGKTFLPAFLNSLLMIIVTELGDKTFFIAAILAMKYSRQAVWIGAVGALALMTVLSAAMGFALPNLLPRKYTHYAAALLFLYFGIILLKDASGMRGSGPSDELQEVEEELIHKKDQEGGGENGHDEEHGGAKDRTQMSSREDPTRILTQAFTLTFLAEWGDRSQIATIALAAAKNPYGVTLGGVIGHALCTGIAVLGGRMLAARISEKTVATVGGVVFLGFAVYSFVVPDF